MFSRRDFLKAAGQGIALTAVGVRAAPSLEAAALAQTSPFSLPTPIAQEQGAFLINGKSFTTAYEARTTLWEVIAVKAGLTGTNRSCNKASCGACSVLIDGVPFYSCHTLAMEAAGRKILTIEGIVDEKSLHPLQRIGHQRVAADCGFCTAGWVVTAKGLLDKNRNPSEDDVKAALAGHICRCAAYPSIVSTVIDSAAVMRGEKDPVVEPHSIVHIKQPMVRDFSTGGGHSPGDTIVEGDSKIVTKKWQGYAPQNLNVVGKPMPPLAEVAMPRFLGKAEYATRVVFPNMLHMKILTSPHPRARIQRIDTSRAEKMPGVARILTYRDFEDQKPIFGTMGPFILLTRELGFFGEVLAVVAADTEDLAEDALEAIEVEYEVLPSLPTLKHVMSPGAPDIRGGKGNLILLDPRSPHYDPNATWVARYGDTDKGFAEADIVREFTYSFGGATAIPIQPVSCVAKWDGDNLTFWGMGQGIAPNRGDLAKGLGIDISKIRYINKYNGCTFGSAMQASRFNVFAAQIAKATGRPVRLMLHKDQELAHINIKPENLAKFKVGAKKDGRIVSLLHEVHISGGDIEGGGHAVLEISKNNHELYTTKVPHWKSAWYNYRTNVIRAGPVRSYTQQEVKWAWENMMDEMAEAVGQDPIQFRLLHVARPGTVMTKDWHEDFGSRYETLNGELRYDSFASVEVLQEGAKAIGWDQRNPKAGGNPGRFKRGIGMGMSQHHAGHMGYHDGEVYFENSALSRLCWEVCSELLWRPRPMATFTCATACRIVAPITIPLSHTWWPRCWGSPRAIASG